MKPIKEYLIDKDDTIIKDAMFEFYGITFEEVKQPTRKRPLVQKRQLFCYLYRHYTNMTLEYIAEIFNQDYSTVIHSVTTTKNIIQTDRKYRSDVLKIKDIINKKITPHLTKEKLTSHYFNF